MKRRALEKRARAAVLAILALAAVALGPTSEPASALAATDAGAASNEEGGDTSDMKLVPAGPFTMGADRGGQEDEHPAHQVDLPAFWLDITEVTNEAYERCVDAFGSRRHIRDERDGVLHGRRDVRLDLERGR